MFKDKFLYPTKKNLLMGFLMFQFVPLQLILIESFLVGGSVSLVRGIKIWLYMQPVLISSLLIWRLKPEAEFDEREKEINLKWNNKALDYIQIALSLGVIAFVLFPEITKINLMLLFMVPHFVIFVACSVMMKREIGYFIATNSEFPLEDNSSH